MAATVSAIQLEANRANALLSSGPKTPQGKLASSSNSLAHGLTSRNALLPGENPEAYAAHHANYLAHYPPQTGLDRAGVTELADLDWRVRRAAAFEAHLIDAEVHNLVTNPDLQPLTAHLTLRKQLIAFAFTRLIQSKVLTNLHTLEARLARRSDNLRRRLEAARPADKPPALRNRKIEPIAPPPSSTTRIGRNAPCPCNSGRKYKFCCAKRSSSAT